MTFPFLTFLPLFVLWLLGNLLIYYQVGALHIKYIQLISKEDLEL